MRCALASGLAIWAAAATSCAWYVTEADRREAADRDGDGYASSRWPTGTDCDDSNPQVHPAAQELCDDAIDNDCNGLIDDVGIGQVSWYRDDDDDGYGRADVLREACRSAAATGWSLRAGDCDESDPTVNPAAEDSDCDGIDENCDGTADEAAAPYFADEDRDGYGDPSRPLPLCERPADSSPFDQDCNDEEPSVYPGGLEVCDALDNDCNGSIDDVDGIATVAGSNYAKLDVAFTAAITTGSRLDLCSGDHTVNDRIELERDETLTVRGVQGRDTTSLTRPTRSTVFVLQDSAHLEVEGVEVHTCFAGIHAYDKSSFVLNDMRIRDCNGAITIEAPEEGPGVVGDIWNTELNDHQGFLFSAIFGAGNFDLDIRESTFDNNSFALILASIGESFDVVLNRCTVTNNHVGILDTTNPPGTRIESIATDWGTPGVDDNSEYDAFGESWWGVASFVCKYRDEVFGCR